MKRNGLVLAGGIVGIARGALGSVIGLTTFSTLELGESMFPGYSAVIVFEFIVSLAVLAIGIFAIVKSNDPASGKIIRILGIAIIAAAVIDVIWAIAILGSAAISSGAGSLLVLGLIGALLTVGGGKLAASGQTPLAPPAPQVPPAA